MAIIGADDGAEMVLRTGETVGEAIGPGAAEPMGIDAIGVEIFERAGLLAWPSLEIEWDGAWVRRAAGGYSKRANCIQCFDPADGENVPARIGAASAWLAARGLTPIFRSTPLTSPVLEAALDAARWRTIGRSHLYALHLGAHLDEHLDEHLGKTGPDAPIRLFDRLDPVFLAAQHRLHGLDTTSLAGLRAVLAVLAIPAAGVVLFGGGQARASGLMAVADGIVITGLVVTDAAYRRQGLAGAMMRAGLAWARKQGARLAALNVEADNSGAQALYRGLGYRRRYDYAYRLPAEPGWEPG